ncbi:MAG: tetratricopeptide repeat protein [Albidovulum sp.]|nr:tetratricopeptide repeat protein [Albidovulum sp.]
MTSLANCPIFRFAATIALALLLANSAPAQSQDIQDLDALFEQLQGEDSAAAALAEQQIFDAWSDSGSASMNLLLYRGRRAMQTGEFDEAIEHLSALIDHAPEFAEGWNARATAYFYKGEFALSVSDIFQTLARNPRHYGAISGLGMIFERSDEPERAAEAYGHALRLNPHNQGLQISVERLKRKLDELTY